MLHGRICSQEREEQCQQKYAEESMEWACRECNCLKEVHPWIAHLFSLYHLRMAGYPFDKNDLSLEEWIALGILQQEIKAVEDGAQQEDGE